VHPDGSVTFNLHAPEASSVAVAGDYPIRHRAMTRDREGIWSVTVEPLCDDFYAYRFTVDGVSLLDPGNVFGTRDGRRYMSWAVVPGPRSDNYEVNDVPHGQVAHLWYPSPTLDLTRRMTVYTPPGYEAGQERYPVLYLLHGGGGDEDAWTEMGRAPEIFDNLIAAGEVVPMIVVMGNGNVDQAAAPNHIPPTPGVRPPPAPRAPGQNPFADQRGIRPASSTTSFLSWTGRSARRRIATAVPSRGCRWEGRRPATPPSRTSTPSAGWACSAPRCRCCLVSWPPFPSLLTRPSDAVRAWERPSTRESSWSAIPSSARI
jgi:hypothetical protein